MDTATAAMANAETVVEESVLEFQVNNFVCHGDYRKHFKGYGATLLEAAEDAARQSSYAYDLFDPSDSRYERRAELRAKLAADLEVGIAYTGFGWNTFYRVY